MSEEIKEEIEALMSIYEDDMEGLLRSISFDVKILKLKLNLQCSKNPQIMLFL